LSANSTDLAGNVSATTTATVPKDTVAPGAPSANYTDNNNAVADQIGGSAEANASITVTETSPAGTQTFTTSANSSGAYSVAVAATNGTHSAPVSVTCSVTARDAAGNTSSATTISPSDQH
jgi:hypothetical protein